MFHDDHAARGDEIRAIEEIQRKVFLGFFVGRVDEDEVREQVAACNFFQAGDGVGMDQFRIANFEGFEISGSAARLFHTIPKKLLRGRRG